MKPEGIVSERKNWKENPYINLIFDKKTVTKETFRLYLRRIYEELINAKGLKKKLITEDKLKLKKATLQRIGRIIKRIIIF